MFLLRLLKPLFKAIKPVMILVCCPSLTWADLPLTVENLISDKKQWRIQTSFLYANRNTQAVQTAQPITLQIDETSFLTLPTQIGQVEGITDIFITVLGLRYGVTDNTEAYTRASHLYEQQRGDGLEQSINTHRSQLVDAWLGINHQLSYDDATPALIGFMEVALREKHSQSTASGKSWSVGLTTYRAIDPVVLSLSSTYHLNQARDNGQASLEPGNLWVIHPSVSFAVNDRVTLTTGVQWSTQKAQKVDGFYQGFRQTQTHVMLGLGYGVSKSSVLDVAFNTSASGSNDLRVQWLYSL